MKCFYHHDNESSGICKNCNKGICVECITELDNGIACKNRCEDEVLAVNQIIDRGKTSYRKTGSAFSQNSLLYFLMGVSFIVFGIFAVPRNASFYWFSIVFGGVCIIGAILNFITSQRFSQK